MNVGELTAFIAEHWATIVATVVVVAPILWVMLHFLFRHRIELFKAQEEALKQQNDSLKQENNALRQQLDAMKSQHLQAPMPARASANHDTAELIGEWTRLIYEVKSRYQTAMQNQLPWPGDSLPLVERENALYSKILSRLDRSELAQDRLASELSSFREMDDTSSWYKRRESLMSSLSYALRSDTSR
ncbi:hypothetical protein [Halomonas sp. E19]|uniref:hypothetical protein n=1 Tax=Halomonas sp. E19 TaxID=3397247 RepID=UPI0040343A1A